MSENHDSDGEGRGGGGCPGGSSAPVPDPNSLQAFGLSFGQSFGQAFGQALGEQLNQGLDPSLGPTGLQRPAFDPASAVTPAVAQALAALAQPGRQIVPWEPRNGPEHNGNCRAEEAEVPVRDEELLNSRAENSALREQVAQLQTQLAHAQASLDSKNEEYEDVRDKMLSFRAEANRLKATLTTVESSLADSKQECQCLTSDLETANAAFRGADEKRQSLDKELGLVRNSYAASEERNFQLQTKNTNTLAHLEAERSKSKSREAELALSKESYRAITERRNELRSQLGGAHSYLRQFLMGSMTSDAGWMSAQVKIMLSDEGMVLIERSPETMSVWELLPAWAPGIRGQIASQDLNCITLQLVILFQLGCWDVASGACDVLCKLKASLLDSSTAAIPRWMGSFFFSVLSWAVSKASPDLVVRIAAWQILWLLYHQWPRVCDKTFLEGSVDPICRALRNGRPDFADLESYAQLKTVGPFDLVCPPDKSGVLFLDSAASTMRWVAMEMVDFGVFGLKLSPPAGSGETAIEVGVNTAQIVWALQHLR
ncbi:hypothetical protein NM208_g10528 [Fusarium decemcellulare]|uniref:Uncharacterized protein n=1 Tax=Fusarium decemcellulare TaxID=57161 RepID=A0ACC1RXI6_9HYPO|nr:hypothetical protein NM208_g10528 [Fusarium decemcellulare]